MSKKGNRQINKKHLMLVDKYVKKEEKKNQDKDSGNDNISPKTESTP